MLKKIKILKKTKIMFDFHKILRKKMLSFGSRRALGKCLVLPRKIPKKLNIIEIIKKFIYF